MTPAPPQHGRFRSNPRWLFVEGVSLSLLLCLTLTGCFLVRPVPPESFPPKELTVHYLKGICDVSTQKEMYDLLTAKARSAISYSNFLSIRRNEIPALIGRRAGAETRIFVSPFEQYDFSRDHSVVYALMTVRHPYSMGEREKYALVRLHCHREGGQWCIEPFMHEETGTVILVPTRMRGPLWRISDDMERIANLVRDEISTYQERREPPREKVVQAESPEEPPLVIPDVLGSEAPRPSPPELDTGKKVDALVSIGRLCYEAGKIDAAEDTFRRVLALDPDSAIAKDYLSRCANYRLLQKEKEEAARMIEELLKMESEERSREKP
jgi:tetratricopeptide (TPR) repeat protein